jgi:hypothetical protein
MSNVPKECELCCVDLDVYEGIDCPVVLGNNLKGGKNLLYKSLW